jgi:hypothetical protein
MKRTVILLLALLMLMPLYAQEKFRIDKNSFDSECKDLIAQLNVLLIFGRQFAKSHQMDAIEYGKYVGEEYVKEGWAKGGNFEGLTHACLYNLSCFMPESEIEIITKTSEMVKIKSGLVDGFIKKREPCFVITGKEYQDFITAALSTIAEKVGCIYTVEVEGDIAYTTISKK